MSDCPSGLDLDEWSVERAPGALADHIRSCPKCTAYIAQLDAETAVFLQAESPEAFVHRPAIAAELNRPDSSSRSFWARYGVGALAGLAAAAVALFVMLDRGKPSGQSLPPATPETDVVRIKGNMSLAVVRKRGSQQTRHTGSVSVKPGDELRVELTTSQEASITVGIRTDNGEWVPLREGFTASAGTGPVHDDAIAFDAEPTRGWVIAGSPNAVADALTQGIVEQPDVSRLRIEWESE